MNSPKIVLLDIFSYSCMNCLRSLEFIKKINSRYRSLGLITILVHPPEWKFEKKYGNIAYALKKYKIRLPVIIDKNKKIIKKLKIGFWPAQVLIEGRRVMYKHVGEGDYKKLEDKIIGLLNVGNPNSKRAFVIEPRHSRFSPVYLGNRKAGKSVKLIGKWLQTDECLLSKGKKCSLRILTKGASINFVAESSSKKPIKAGVRLDNKYIKSLTVNKPQLYKIIKLRGIKRHKLELTANRGLAVYSFSFQ